MKVKVNKNKSYREKQRKAAAIKAGVNVSSVQTGKYAPDIPDYIIQGLIEQGLGRDEALDFAKQQLLVRTISFNYGDDVRCQMCGRRNYPVAKEGQRLQWSVERSLFLVNRHDFRQQPRPDNSMILCQDCLKHAIEEQYHTNGNFIICNDGSMLGDASSLLISIDLKTENDLYLWLDKKYNLDKEYYSLNTGMEIANWLRNLWKSHALYCNGFLCHDRCYEIMCKHLGLPYNAEEHAIATELYFQPMSAFSPVTDTGKG